MEMTSTTLIVVSLLLLAGIAILTMLMMYLQSRSQHRVLRSQFAQIQTQYEGLQTQNARVQAQYDEVHAQNAQIHNVRERLQNQHSELQARHTALQTDFNDQVRDQLTVWRSKELEHIRQELGKAAQENAMAAAERWFIEHERRIRAEAISQSASVVTGKVTEHLMPYIGQFPHNPRDARFLGSPIDLIVFEGMDDDNLQKVVFLEVKTGTGSLSKRERQLRDAVRAGRVEWKQFHLPIVSNSSSAPSA
jgi:predicted Holliday junction resolvase-like endonuclease